MKTIIQINKKMKTVKEASQELEFNTGLIHSNPRLMCERSFDSGAEFAQRWIDVNDELPENENDINNSDIDCLCTVEGLSMNASEYTEYKVLKFRKKLNCFIEWVYNSKGEFISVKYNDTEKTYPDKPRVTFWRPIDLK